MKYETRRKIVNVVAGTAIAAAIALGVAYGGHTIKKVIQYENTQVTYNETDYKLKDLYVLSNENGKELCYQKEIDSKTSYKVVTGVTVGNDVIVGTDGSVGFHVGGNNNPGDMVIGVSPSTTKTYGYITLDTNELIAVKGLEHAFGYNAEKVADFISFETAKENNFQITTEEFMDYVALNSGKTR